MIARRVLMICVISAVARNGVAQGIYQDVVQPFLKDHCLECHGAEQPEAGLRLDILSPDITPSTKRAWQDVWKVLTEGEMPPADQPRPDLAENATVVSWIQNRLTDAERQLRAAQPMRRLDRDEYRISIGDLLKLDVSLFDPTRDFPAEVGPAGRENVSLDSLTRHYLAAANASIERAIHTEACPREETHVFQGRFSAARSEYSASLKRNDCETLLVGPKQKRSHLTLKQYHGTPAAGTYRIRITATAFDPEIYFDEIKGIEKGEPLRLAIEFPGPAIRKPPREISYGEFTDRSAKTVFELNRDGKAHDYDWDVWLEASMHPRLSFANGPTERPSEVWVLKNFPDLWKYPDAQLADQTAWQESMRKILMDRYRGPMIHVHKVSITGPITTQWPPPSHRLLMSVDGSEDVSTNAEERLRRFAERAFRRPVKLNDIEPIVSLVRSQLAHGKPPLEALKTGFKSILCSPSFIFLVGTR